MTRARRELVDIETTPYYHCIRRCVRRAFLCGKDSFTGKSYEHRKPWILKPLRFLQSIFSVELCVYTIMSYHYHLVVRLNDQAASSWSEEVRTQFLILFNIGQMKSLKGFSKPPQELPPVALHRSMSSKGSRDLLFSVPP